MLAPSFLLGIIYEENQQTNSLGLHDTEILTLSLKTYGDILVSNEKINRVIEERNAGKMTTEEGKG